MKKRITRLLTALLLVAVFVTGVFFASSADPEVYNNKLQGSYGTANLFTTSVKKDPQNGGTGTWSGSDKAAAMEAGSRRMRPIFLTSATTALGVLPMIISHNPLWMPMGVVICFGVVLSLVIVLSVMPVTYWQIYRRKGEE